MRIPTLVLGLAALIALPALLVAELVSRDAAPTAGFARETARKASKATKAGHARKAPSRAGKSAGPKPTPAKVLFGAVATPAPLAPRSIGFYAKGCLAGAAALPIDGPAWQVMRLSRNRNWGHPDLIDFLEKFAVEAKQKDGWPGLLVGDISQPRGGPMSSGHASHQVGLDADVWLTPMPDRRLSGKEREDLAATSMLAADGVSVDPKLWTDAHVRLIKRAASYPQVERVLVHPAIKKALCQASVNDKGAARAWLDKVRPYWGHYYHFHIRIACPKGSTQCEHQPAVPGNDGCGAELKRWLKLVKPPPVVARPAKPAKPAIPAHERHPITLAQLPSTCRAVLAAGAAPSTAAKTPSQTPAKTAAKPTPAKPAPHKASMAQ
jgi:penicillin-insensitive murein endopeptidase